VRTGLLALAVVVACGGGDDDGDGGEGQVARAVAKIASCSATSPTVTAAFSLPAMNGDDLECVLAADGCEEVLACFGFRIADDCPAEDTCLDGETLSACRGPLGLPLEIDCAAWHGNGGSSCLEGVGGVGACGTGSCASEGETCNGARLEDCEDGVLEVQDCAEHGLTCTVASDSETVCADADSGAACTDEDHCEGETLVRCENGVETRVDCGAQYPGATCVQEVGSSDVLCGYGSDCAIDLGSPSDACQGSSLTFCMVGLTTSVDCTDIGFSGCSTDPPGPGCR